MIVPLLTCRTEVLIYDSFFWPVVVVATTSGIEFILASPKKVLLSPLHNNKEESCSCPSTCTLSLGYGYYPRIHTHTWSADEPPPLPPRHLPHKSLQRGQEPSQGGPIPINHVGAKRKRKNRAPGSNWCYLDSIREQRDLLGLLGPTFPSK